MYGLLGALFLLAVILIVLRSLKWSYNRYVGSKLVVKKDRKLAKRIAQHERASRQAPP